MILSFLLSKGKWVDIPIPVDMICVATLYTLVDVGKRPGKSCLFFFTAVDPGIRLTGERVNRLVKHGASTVSGALLLALEKASSTYDSYPWPYSSPHQVSKVNSLESIEQCR
jgi:hypothetical protein